MATTTFNISDELLPSVNSIVKEFNFESKEEFFQEAVRDKVLELTKKLNQAFKKKPKTQETSAKPGPRKTKPQPRDGGSLRSTASIPKKTRTAQKQVRPQQRNQAKSLSEKNLKKPPSGLKSTATIPDKPKNMENESVATDWK